MAKRVKSITGWSSGISISEDDDDVPYRVIFSLLPLLSITSSEYRHNSSDMILTVILSFNGFYNIMTSQSNLELDNFLHSS